MGIVEIEYELKEKEKRNKKEKEKQVIPKLSAENLYICMNFNFTLSDLQKQGKIQQSECK